jgi:hypothetical protein
VQRAFAEGAIPSGISPQLNFIIDFMSVDYGIREGQNMEFAQPVEKLEHEEEKEDNDMHRLPLNVQIGPGGVTFVHRTPPLYLTPAYAAIERNKELLPRGRSRLGSARS